LQFDDLSDCLLIALPQTPPTRYFVANLWTPPLSGRWYVRKVRAASTDKWRGRVLQIALEQAELRTRGEIPAPPAVTSSFVVNDSEAQLPDAADEPAERPVAAGVAIGDAVEPPPFEENEDGDDGDDGEEMETEAPCAEAATDESYLQLLETAAQATAAAASSSVAVTALVEVTTLAAADVNKLKVIAIRLPSACHLPAIH
jgi:hypothetical protein